MSALSDLHINLHTSFLTTKENLLRRLQNSQNGFKSWTTLCLLIHNSGTLLCLLRTAVCWLKVITQSHSAAENGARCLLNSSGRAVIVRSSDTSGYGNFFRMVLIAWYSERDPQCTTAKNTSTKSGS